MANGYSLPRLSPHLPLYPIHKPELLWLESSWLCIFAYSSLTPLAAVFPQREIAEEYGYVLSSTTHSHRRESSSRQGQNTETRILRVLFLHRHSIRLVLLRLKRC
jgi:hypothetical protein